MLRTRVGYTGGKKKNPTYTSIGDHTEAFQVDFNPKLISYERLLEIFWSTHSPCSSSWSVQYRSALFYHNGEQRQKAEASREALAVRKGLPIKTPLLPAGEFTFAEDYHQKYSLRCDPVLQADFAALFPDPIAFVNSTAAMRVNAFLCGYRSDDFEAVLKDLDLSAKSREILSLPAR